MKSTHPLCLLALMISAATPLRAETFSLLVYESPAELARRDGAGAEAYWRAYSTFAAQLADAGVLRGGTALTPADAGAASTAQIGGYFVIEVADAAAARALAAKAPNGVVHVAVSAHRNNPLMTTPR